MAYDFKFPDVGEGISEGELIRWLVKEGDEVKEHQTVAEIETDKAVVEMPSPRAGIVLKIYHSEGDTVKVGEALLTIGEAGEKLKEPVFAGVPKAAAASVSAKAEVPSAAVVAQEETLKEPVTAGATKTATSPAAAASEAVKPSVAGEGSAGVAAPPAAAGEKEPERGVAVVGELPSTMEGVFGITAAPATRALARELGVNINIIRGTGPGGRVTDDDVKKAASGKETSTAEMAAGKREAVSAEKEEPAVEKVDSKKEEPPAEKAAPGVAGPMERVPVKGIRKSVSRKMAESWANAVQCSHMAEADVTHLVEIREREKERAKKRGMHLTYLPFIIKAVIACLKDHPYLNASLEGEEILLKKYYNIGIALDSPDGLMVPVLKGAENKKILEIAEDIERLGNAARERKIDIADLKGGTFTITNVGSLGGVFATPIINYPEVAIIATGKITDKPVVRDGKIEARKIMGLSLTFDHRVVDGAEAARFTNDVISLLEDPDRLLVEL
ncbi:MAG: 2-oxo acid dehydrogenase subunit E2 [Firmicutes bacterium]|nr:2-oxo acid dehydrogenase subunit E2 [Bacillota bacterium]